MAKKSFYAVKSGKTPGIYTSWDECKKQIDGFSGATYKGFATKVEAEEFLGKATQESTNESPTVTIDSNNIAEAVAYVDGSYEDSQKEFSYGLVMFYDGIEEHFCEKYSTPSLVVMRNVAGEIMGAQKAMQFCIDNNIKSLDLYYDYEGIEKWCTEGWKANKPGSINYKKFYDGIKSNLKVNFYKVKAHTGDKYNELADQLAKSALKGTTAPEIVNSVNNMTANGITSSDLSAIFELLKEDISDLIINDVVDPYGYAYTLTSNSPLKQKLKVVHYENKKKIWIQGKKEDLFNQLSLYIVELIESDEVPQFLNTVHNLNIDKDFIKSELSIYCPNACAELNKYEKIKNSLLQAIYNLNLGGDMFDCTYLVGPALRPLEGVLKIALQEHNIPIKADGDNRDSFFVFNKSNGRFHLKSDFKKDEHTQEFLEYISTAYTHYNNHRHNLSHWDNPLLELDTTRVIKSTVEAHTLIKDTLKIIDQYYKL